MSSIRGFTGRGWCGNGVPALEPFLGGKVSLLAAEELALSCKVPLIQQLRDENPQL